MYCVITDWDDSILYLAWQNPVFLEDDGYFWTREETFRKILHDSTPEHPFLFKSEDEAKALLDKIKLPQRCQIVCVGNIVQ